MSERPIKNVADSVRQRLLKLSREKKEDFAFLLDRFAAERFLYRLSESQYADQFIVKGAFVLLLWSGALHRPTRDVDLLSLKVMETEDFRQIFREICDIRYDDGLVFAKESVSAEIIRENQVYGGIRVFVQGSLTSARFILQFDIGFGDAVTPEASRVEMPILLNLPAPWMKMYPKETLISEKYEAMVKLGIANSRMKDFFDLWYISQNFQIDGPSLALAIGNTFRRRKTALPETLPVALTEEFHEDPDKKKQWKAFTGQRGLGLKGLDLRDIVSGLRLFLVPPTESLRAQEPFLKQWMPGLGWQ